MKSILKNSVAAFSLILFSGSLFAQDSGLKEKIQMLNNDMVKAIVADNQEAIMVMYADDAVSMPSYEPIIKGKDAIMKKNKESQEMGFKINNMTLSTIEVLSSGDLAYEIGTYTIDMTIPGMTDGWSDNGKYLTIWEKQSDDSWKIKIETWNTDNNPWEDMNMSEDDKEK